ncbi:single-stranded DNA-binding protein [Gemmatimonas sp.]
MARSLNRVQLIGHVGGAPELRTVVSGARVATVSLATTRVWKNDQGQAHEKTEWHRLVVWNGPRGSGLADVVEKYVAKGDKLYVEGELEYRQWQDKDGQTRYTTEIKVKDLILLGGRGGAASADGDTSAAPRQTASSSHPRKPTAATTQQSANDFPDALDDDDDDLPF